MKVLLATDGSNYAEEAAWLISHLPHAETLDLFILSVTQTPEVHRSLESHEWMKRYIASARIGASEACQRIEEMFQGANAKVESAVCEGNVAATIVEQAREREVDLVVLGAIGRSALNRIVLGSISDFVATNARCSVLVVRPTGLRVHERRDIRLCLAYDDSAPSKTAIEQLGQFDWKQHTHVDIAHVIAYPFTYMNQPIEYDPEPVRMAAEEHLREAAEDIGEICPSVATHLIEANHVGESLCRFAEEHATDMIVMGDTGRGVIGRFMLGSVTRYVLRHASCSVWACRKP